MLKSALKMLTLMGSAIALESTTSEVLAKISQAQTPVKVNQLESEPEPLIIEPQPIDSIP